MSLVQEPVDLCGEVSLGGHLAQPLRKRHDCLSSLGPVRSTEYITLLFALGPPVLPLSIHGFLFQYLTFLFICLFPSPKNPHRCLAVTSLWMTNILSLALGIRRPRFMKLFIKDKSSCELDSPL